MKKIRSYRSNILLLTSFLAVISVQLLLSSPLNKQVLFTLVFFSCFLLFIFLTQRYLYADIFNINPQKNHPKISAHSFFIDSLSHTGLICLEWSREKELITQASSNLTDNLNLTKDSLINNRHWLKHVHTDDKKNLIHFLNTATTNPFQFRIIDNNNEQTEFALTHLFKQPPDTQYQNTIVTLSRLGVAHTMRPKHSLKLTNNSTVLRDKLTGLITVPLLIDRVEQSLRQIDRQKHLVALLIFDIDNFNEKTAKLPVKDSNFIVRNIARRIQESVRTSDTVARIDNDEFIVLLPDLKQEQDISQIAQCILEVIQEPIRLNNSEFKITATAAITIAPNDGVTADMLLKNLRLTLFQSKRNSHNHFQYFSNKLTNIAKQQILMENHLKDGIKKNEFFIHYHAIYSKQEIMQGYSGEIRWHHADNGMLKQKDFSPIAEKSGLISPLIQQVYKLALLKIQNHNSQQKSNCSLQLSLFSRLLNDSHTVNIFEKLLLVSGFNPRLLTLKVKEEDLFSPTEPILDTIEQLDNLGIQIYLDDFSNHYTSVVDLHQIPIKGLILNFPALMEITHQDSEVVSSIIHVAKQMDLKVAIKEISTKRQYQQVAQLPFDTIQGSYLQTPDIHSTEFDHSGSTQIA